jgi:hypothetical protein
MLSTDKINLVGATNKNPPFQGGEVSKKPKNLVLYYYYNIQLTRQTKVR